MYKATRRIYNSIQARGAKASVKVGAKLAFKAIGHAIGALLKAVALKALIVLGP